MSIKDLELDHIPDEDVTASQYNHRIRKHHRKYYSLKFNSEKLQEAIINITNKINELSEEQEVLQELYEESLKVNSL